MQPSRTRLVCRAHNRFTPSIALWQHFVAPDRLLPQQRRLLSSSSQTAQYGADTDNTAHASHVSPSAQPEPTSDAITDASPQPPTIRKPTTVRGKFYANKVDASIAKNLEATHDKRQASLTEPDKLLAATRAAYHVAEDYEGVVVKPMLPHHATKESDLPWCATSEERTLPAMDRLDLEIQRFYEHAKPTRFEKVARKHVVEQVREHVKKTLPGYVLPVFGSEKTGIALPLSDIDLRLVPKSQLDEPVDSQLPPAPVERQKGVNALRNLHYQSLRNNRAYLLPAMRYARYPLVSLQDRQSGLDVQIVLNNDTSVSRVIMQGYMEQYPYLRPLYYVVKTMFDVRGLSDVFRGGFGSYSLFMMIVASIKHLPHPRQDAAGALVNFLKFWRDLDTTKHGVSIEPTLLFDKSVQPVMPGKVKAKVKEGSVNPLPPYMLTLRDPADETNDLGRKGIAIKHVQATIKHLHTHIESRLKAKNRPSLLGLLVATSYMLNLNRRRKLDNYGKQIVQGLQSSLSTKAQALREAEAAEAKWKVHRDVWSMRTEVEEEDENGEARQKQTKEDRDRQWQKLADQTEDQVRLEAERASASPPEDVGDAIASVLSIPTGEHEARKKSATGEGNS